jgi:YD repeat-containing protein
LRRAANDGISCVYDVDNRKLSAGRSVLYPGATSATTTTTSWTYDPQTGRLASISTPNGAVVNYRYDPAGNRKQVQASSSFLSNYVNNYLYDADNRLLQLQDGSGNMIATSYYFRFKRIRTNARSARPYRLGRTNASNRTSSTGRRGASWRSSHLPRTAS